MADTLAHSPSANNADLRHNYALDGVRGLAILMVLGRHLIYINGATQTPLYVFARTIRDCLAAGVDVFFALSGFLITRILVQTLSDRHFFRNFYGRRALRIFPLYYGVLLALFVCSPIFHIQWGGQQWRLLTYSNRLFQSRSGPPFNFFLGHHISLVNFWSLHIEEQFYMLWPLFVFFIRVPRRLLGVTLAISAACLGVRFWMVLHGFSEAYIYTSLISRADSLLFGAALALALRTRAHTLVLKVATPLFITALLLYSAVTLLSKLPATRTNAFLYPSVFTLIGLASTALLAMCLKPGSFTARVFRVPFMRFFGKYSYGIYIFHSVLPLPYLMSFIRFPVHTPSLVAHVIDAAFEMAVAVGVAVLSYHYFEMPFLKLKRYFNAEQPSPPTIQTNAAPVSA